MSIQAWYYRAKDLGIISENAFDNFWKSLNAKGLTKQELGDPYPLETTSRHRRLVARAYADGRISESRAAELLGVSVSDLHCILMDGLGDVQVDVA